MKIVAYDGDLAVCEADGQSRHIDMMLLGHQAIGTWVLVFLDTAREVMSEEYAEKVTAALQAVNRVMQGEEQVDHWFADLLNKEPELPLLLRQAAE